MLLYVIVMTQETRATPEEKLLQRLRQGKKGAAREWFQRYAPEIRDYVGYKIDRPAVVEEIVQETFINCLKHLPVFNGRSSIATWMKSIARHEVADYYRQRYAKKALQLLPLREALLGDEGILAKEEVVVRVRQVLAKIRQDYKELLLLKYVDGKKVKTIARELGRSFKSVEADLFRAREDFREVYVSLNPR